MRSKAFWCVALSIVSFGSFAVPLAIHSAYCWADEDDDDDDDDDDSVHDLMEKTHEGRKSPWKKANKAASADPIDWAAILAALPQLQEMSSALANSKNQDVRDAADVYVDAVQDLAAQAKVQDAMGTRNALKTLSQSCGDCHYQGGPGGRRDD